MRNILYLSERHLKIFFKKPLNIILSLLSSLVILSLYFLFIRDFTIKAVSDYGFPSNNTSIFVDKLMISGLIIVIGSTISLSILSIFIKDKCTGIIKDFLVTPTSKFKIITSYILTSFIIANIFTFITLIISELFYFFYYDLSFNLNIFLFSYLIIILSNLISSTLIFTLSFFINSESTFSTFETLYGVVIGFFTGVYIPIGYYPNIIRNIFFFFPLTETTNLLRKINTYTITKEILSNYPTSTHHILYETFGINLVFNNNSIPFFKVLLLSIISLLVLQLIINILTIN